MMWMVRSSVGMIGPFCSYVAPCKHTISGINFSRYSYCVVLHVQLNIHSSMVLSWWLPCWLLTLMSVRCVVYTFDSSKLVGNNIVFCNS